MRRQWWLYTLVAGAFLMIGANAFSAGPFDKVIEARTQLMKDIGGFSKAMRQATDAAGVAANADKLAEAFAKVNEETFPKGSSEGSRAKPEIWEKWDEFTAAAKNAVMLAQGIATKARAGEDTAELVKGYGRSACGSCHRPFRLPKS
ncbi:MAG: cytochrome c [Deltaproteobacteria bacterium]|nr:cytochrome c [Deltaproteobacteria bacterium]